MKLDEVFPDHPYGLEEGPTMDRIRRGLTTAAALGGIGLGVLGTDPAQARQAGQETIKETPSALGRRSIGR